MGFLYGNILEWMKREVTQVSYDPYEQLEWLSLVRTAVEEIFDDFEKTPLEQATEIVSPNSVLVDSEPSNPLYRSVSGVYNSRNTVDGSWNSRDTLRNC